MLNAESGKTWGKLTLISEHARKDASFQFTSLAHLLDGEFLRDCHVSLNRNKAVGVDKVSWEDYDRNLDENLNVLVSRLKRKKFKPRPARRVYIPKNEGEKRPLGIPAHENKVVEKGLTKILESIYEEDFLDCSYGFRPGKNCHQAVRRLGDIIMSKPVNHIIESDIKGFFDNVSHEKLMELLRIRISDSSTLLLIERFLKAGYIDDGLLARSDKGTPQGSILSPLLANVFLHYVLDEWFENTVKKHTEGYCELVRYADDFVCVAQKAKDAERIEKALKKRFEKFGLEIHPDKSRRFSFGRFEKENAEKQNRKANTFDFLGFTHYCDKSRNGKFKVGRKTSRKRFTKKSRDMKMWLKNIRNQGKAKDWWETLKSKLRGHYQYYGVSENYRGIRNFYTETLRSLHKWMNRRSQKGRMSWKDFHDYIRKYPLPKPKIVHNFYSNTW